MSDAAQIIRAIEKLVAGDRHRLTISKETSTGSLFLVLGPDPSKYVGGYEVESFSNYADAPVTPEAFNAALVALIRKSAAEPETKS